MYTNLELTSKLERLRQIHLSSKDWVQEQLDYVLLRGSWFVQSEYDFKELER